VTCLQSRDWSVTESEFSIQSESTFFPIAVLFSSKRRVIFFSRGVGFELRALYLQKQALYHLSYTSIPFWSGYFRDGVL
jgi:hypothetical protein